MNDEKVAKVCNGFAYKNSETGVEERHLWHPSVPGELTPEQIKDLCKTPPVLKDISPKINLWQEIFGMNSHNCAEMVRSAVDENGLPLYPKGRRREALAACLQASFGKKIKQQGGEKSGGSAG